eukprot:jgi/Bigna1/135197/aug1.28_g9905
MISETNSTDLLFRAKKRFRAMKSVIANAPSQAYKYATGIVPGDRIEVTRMCEKGMWAGMALLAVSFLATIQSPSTWLTRIVILRSTAFVYFVAFLVARNQNKALIGDNGLTPAKDLLAYYKRGHFANSHRQYRVHSRGDKEERLERKDVLIFEDMDEYED